MLTGLNERRIRRWLRKKVVWAVLVGLLLAGAWPMAAMGRARGGGAQVLEKDVNLDTTLRLAGFLRARGMPVVSTREQDVTVPLGRRTDLANALRPDVFLSLHNNGSTSPSAHGTEVYYQLGNASGGALAAKILHRVTSRLGLAPRGTFTRPGRHGDYYHILREARSTSVLVEGAFVSNPTEARLLADPGFRQGMAEAIGDALLEHLGTLQLQGPPPPGAQPGPAGSMAPPQELRGEARERVLLK